MSRRILVAGAGHGGLSAAIHLAKAGYDVTVYEKANREAMGYDWHDTFFLPAMEILEIDRDRLTDTLPFYPTSYHNPKKTVKINVDGNNLSNLICVDRKQLLNLIFDKAIESGVKFEFNSAAESAIIKENRVTGLIVNGKEIYGDMVIDSAGMYSTVRSSLPESFGIQRNFARNEIFYVYRIICENKDNFIGDLPYNVYFYHCSRPGMDWIITFENSIDILVGGFNPINREDVEKALEDFRKEYPSIGEKIRAGSFHTIPLRRAISKFVADGYAAIGDCASMTEPLSGSGMAKSIAAGKDLADIIISADDGEYTTEVLWEYEYNYITRNGSVMTEGIIRDFMSDFKAEDIDYFLEKKILTQKEVRYAGFSHDTPKEILSKIPAVLPKIYLMPKFARLLSGFNAVNKIKNSMPENYDKESYEKWRKLYEKI